jgi:hypothetical protein
MLPSYHDLMKLYFRINNLYLLQISLNVVIKLAKADNTNKNWARK